MNQKKDITMAGMILLNVINIGYAGFWAFDGAIMPLFLTSKFELSNTAISLILGIGKFMVIMSMFIGLFSDLTHTKMGKRRPLMLVGGLLAAPLMFLIPNMPYVWMLVITITIIYFGMQFAGVPYFSIVPEVVPNEKLATANAFFNAFGGLGTLLAYTLFLSVIYKANKPLAFYLFGVIILIGVLVSVFSTKEHVQEEPPRVNKFKAMFASVGEIYRDRVRYRPLFVFLLMNLFFWLGLGAFMVFFTKFMEYYVNVPGEEAGLVLGVVVIVAIVLSVPVGILGDKISRKGMTLFGLSVVMVALFFGYLMVGPGSSVSGKDLADSATVRTLAENRGYEMAGVDLESFVKEPFDPPRDINDDEMNDKKSDVMRWCLNGTLDQEKCMAAAVHVMGEGNPSLEPTVGTFLTMSKSIKKETKKVLTIAFCIIAFASIGLTSCFVLTATILPTLMPENKLGLYMGFYSTVSGFGQFLSLTIAGAMIDLTIDSYSLGYRWIFLQGTVCLFLAILCLIKVSYIPNADQPTVSDLERQKSGA